MAAASYRICAWAEQHGVAVLPHYSPGYPGWDVAAVRPPTSLVPCETCSLPRCAYRRLPRRRSLPAVEGVGALPPLRSPLSAHGRYSVGPRTLRRWARERLQVSFLAGGAVEARFRYDGTTCSNLGRPLAFDYDVRLASPEEGYRIVAARCAPAPDDVGHRSMCRYLEDPEALMAGIAAEHPLLGRPLEEVLEWRRAPSPAGCYCTSESRAHKWGLVLEVLHYALSRDAGATEVP